MLVDNEYIDSNKADRLNPIADSPVLENAIKSESKLEALLLLTV